MGSYHITTKILVPATSYALTDLPTVHDELQIDSADISNDPFLTRAINQVSRSISRYCNRVFALETVRDTITPQRDAFPFVVPGGVDPLQLSRHPVVQMQTVKLVDAPGTERLLREGADYRVDAPAGQLIRLDQYQKYPTMWWPVTTHVTYQAGYTEIPDDLVDIALRLITARFYNRGRDPTLKSQTQPGLGEQSYWVGSVPGVKGLFPEDITAALDQFRTPVTA